MKYFLQRDGRTYGPYSYDDLKRYQAENRIGPNDLIRKEDSQQWEPWQQVLNAGVTPAEPAAPSGFGGAAAGIGGAAAGFGAAAMTPAPQPEPQAPSFGGGAPAFGESQPPASGFGAPGGFGQPPAQPSSFGQPPSQPGGFGQPPSQPGGFGQPPAQPGGFGGGGFGQPAPPSDPGGGAFGGFGTQPSFGGGQQPGFGGGQPAPGGFGGQPMGGGFGGGAVGPMPPDMQWWLVLIIGMFTCGLFLIFWIYKQAQFVKKIDPQTDAPKFYMYALILYVGGYVVIFLGALLAGMMGSEIAMVLPLLGQLVVLGGAVCLILAAFKMRTSIHNYYTTVEPMGINLMDTTGAVLTFFFSVYFFQYHFANIAMRKKAMGHPAV
jgi:hypothetical protein